MGKNLTSQKRGKGSSTFRAHSFRYAGKARHHSLTDSEMKSGVSGRIVDLIHSSGHYAPLARVKFDDSEECLMVAPYGVKVGDTVSSGISSEVKDGNTLPLEKIPEGALVYNIEAVPGDGGKFVRTSGGFARVVVKTKSNVTVLLPSKKERVFNPYCRASIGVVAGSGRPEKPLLKAGIASMKKRAHGKMYPIVSGVSMNAVDHPHGSSGGMKGSPTIAPRYAPAGAKVGMIRPRRSGRRKR